MVFWEIQKNNGINRWHEINKLVCWDLNGCLLRCCWCVRGGDLVFYASTIPYALLPVLRHPDRHKRSLVAFSTRTSPSIPGRRVAVLLKRYLMTTAAWRRLRQLGDVFWWRQAFVQLFFGLVRPSWVSFFWDGGFCMIWGSTASSTETNPFGSFGLRQLSLFVGFLPGLLHSSSHAILRMMSGIN